MVTSIIVPFVFVGTVAASSGCDIVVAEGESIQEAIDDASVGGTVCVSSGTYSESLTISVDGVSLVAAEGATPILESPGSDTGIEIEGGSDVTVRGFEIRNYGSYGIHVSSNGHNVTIEETRIENSDRGIWLRDDAANEAVIRDNEVVANGVRGIHIGENNENVEVRDNVIENNAGYGINSRYAPGTLVEDNTITGNGATGVAIWDEDSVVRGNTISDHSTVGIRLSHDGDGALVEDNTLSGNNIGIRGSAVSDPEIRNNIISGSEIGLDFSSVRTATVIDNELDAGVVIDGSSGTFAHFDHEMTGNTVGGDPLVFVKDEDNPAIPDDAKQIIVVDSTNVAVSGHGLADVAAGIQIAFSEDVVVTDNTVEDTAGSGIQVWASNDVVVSDNTVTHNGGVTGDPSIGISGSSSTTVRGNTVMDAADWAVQVIGSPDSTIENNELSDNRDGLRISNSDDSLIANNTITGTHHGGGYVSSFRSAILVTGSERLEFHGNHIFDNAGNGIHDNRGQNSRHAVMRDNVITGNGNYGIYWGNSRDATITNNIVSDNGGTGIYGPFGATITENTVENNAGGFNAGGIRVSHNALIENNVVHANGNNGVHAGNASVVRDNTITDSSGAGILIRYNGYQTIENNDVSGHQADLVIFETERVTVRDNTFETGVQLISSSNPYTTLVEDLTTHSFSGNTVAGKELFYAYGANDPSIPVDPGQVIVVNSTGVDISGIDFWDVTAPIQIAFSQATVSNNTITDSTGSTVPRGTITLWASDDSLVADNVVSGSADDGLRIVETEGVDLIGNTVSNAERDGVKLEGARNAMVSNNAISGSGGWGMSATSNSGVVNATNNWWGNETGPSGGVEDPETGTTADGDGDSVSENVRFDPWLTSSPTDESEPEAAFFELSSISTNSPVNAGDDLIVDGTVTNTGDVEETQTVELENFDGTVVDSIAVTLPGSGDEQFTLTWTTQASDVGTGDITVRSEDESVTEGVSVTSEGPIAVDECTVIDTPGTYFLDSDLTGSTTCIQISSSDVTFDGMGHTIQGDELNDSDNQYGILVYNPDERLENVVVRNVTVDGWDIGVRLWDVDDSELTDVTAENGGSGVSLLNANSNELSNIETRNNSFRSVILSSSGQNTLSGIESTNDQVDASYRTRGSIYVFSSNQNEFESVDVTGGFAGVRVSFSLGNSFTGVTASNSTNHGIEVGSNSNEFSDVTVTESGWHGIKIETASSNQFENVSVSDIDGSAIRLTHIGGSGSAPRWNVFENVTVTDNDGSAVSLSGSSNNQFRNLTLGSNEGAAITLASSSHSNLFEGGEIDQGSYRALNFGSNSAGNTVRDVTLLGTGTAFSASDGDPNNVVERLNMNGTTVSFAALGASISPADPSTIPEGASPIDKYVSVSPAAPATHVEYLHFHYDAADVESVDETALGVWRLSDEWRSPGEESYDSGVNATDQFVFAENVTESGTYGVFAEGPQPALAVTNTSLSSTKIEEGDTVTVTADVENVGEVAGDLVVSLEIDGTVVDSETVTLDVNETTDVAFTHPFETEGTYEVAIGGEHAGTVSVSEELFADIVVFGGSISPKSVDVSDGETVTVTGDLYNQGAIEDEETITLRADGEVIAEENVTLTPGEINRSGVEFTWTPDESVLDGEASVDVQLTLNGFVVGTVTVEERYSDIQVIAASTSEIELIEGETAYVIGSIYQAGTIEGTEEITLTATHAETGDTEVVGSQDVTLSPGFYHLGAINISFTPDEPGTYDLTLGDRDAGTVEVEAAQSDIQVIAASADADERITDEEFHVVGSIYQAGNIEGTEEIELIAVDEDEDETVLGSQEVTLAPGFYHLGAINISASFDEPGTYDLELGGRAAGTIEVEAAESDIQVIAASADATERIEGETFHVIGSIYQAGNIEGTQDIELIAVDGDGDETVLGSQEVTLAPGFYHLGAINISASFDEPGTYDLELGGRAAGTIEVEAAESDIQVIAASADATERIEGETFHVIGSIYQAGNIHGAQDIELTATHNETGDETVLGSQEVTLAPGYYHLGAINISASFDEPGTYDLELGGRAAGTIEVEAAESDIRVIAASANADELVEGESFHVVGSIYQAGNIDGPEDIVLNATNTETDEVIELGVDEGRTLSPGFYHLGAINITAEFEDGQAGTYDLTLGDRYAGTIEVEAAVSDIQVISGSLSEMAVTEGEDFYVVGSLYQNGTIDGPQDIVLNATHNETGEVIELGVAEDVELSPGFYHLGAINITAAIDEPGRYHLTLGDRDVGTVGVDESPSDINVIAASLSEIEVLEGEEVYVVGSIYQAGESGTEEIDLVAIDQDTGETTALGSQEVTLESGFYHLGAINISFAVDDAGTYDLELGGHSAGELEVLEPVSDIQVIAASASTDTVITDEEFHVVGSIYQAGNIEGTEDIELTATNQDTGETTSLGSQEVTLAPSFYHLGAINISASFDEPGTYDLELGDRAAGTIEVEAAESDIQVIAASADATERIEGETFNVIGSIYQAGNIDGTEAIELTATHTETGEETLLGSQEVTLSPGFYHLGAINITAALDDPGTYDLELGGRAAGTIEVEVAESDIQVIAASANADERVEGESFYVVGSIYQAGNIQGTQDIELTATHTETGDETVLGSQEVTLSPGFYHLGAINITATLDDPGTYDLELGDRAAGTIDVKAAESDITVIAASASADEVVETESFYVVGSIYQNGTTDGPQTINLTATNQDTGVTEVIGSAEKTLTPGWYHLGALNITTSIGDAGVYDLTLGDRVAGEITVLEPTIAAEIASVNGHSIDVDPETEDETVYASDDVTVDITVDADLDVDEVVVLVRSLDATYSIGVDATHVGGDDWEATIPFESLPDDGRYELSVIATDVLDNGDSDVADVVLMIDRDAPAMAASFEDVDSDDATVVIESDEPLSSAPDVTVELPEGGTSTVTMTAVSPTRYEGSLEFGPSGEYVVSATGTDRAGNEGTDTASVVVNTAFTLGDGVITNELTGTSIAFDLLDDADDALKSEALFLALSESTVNPNAHDENIGVGYLTADLDGLIDHLLDEGVIESATISMAIDEGSVSENVDIDDVGLHHYDASADAWNEVDSSIEYLDDDPFVVATVHEFSTYGALVADDEPPALVSVSPADGETVSPGEITVRFEYEDELTGVDHTSVELVVDGTDVTDDLDSTRITTAFAEHTFDAEPDTSYDVAVTVFDNAGNSETYTTSFTVADGSTSSPQPSQPSNPSQPSQPSDPSTSTPTETETVTPTESAPDSPSVTETPSQTETPPQTETTTTPQPETPDESEDQLGFGWLVALAALLLACGLFRRQSRI